MTLCIAGSLVQSTHKKRLMALKILESILPDITVNEVYIYCVIISCTPAISCRNDVVLFVAMVTTKHLFPWLPTGCRGVQSQPASLHSK